MRKTYEKYPKGIRVAGIVLSHDQKRIVLLERLKEGRHFWVFPGGGFEDTDTNEEAALLRELHEETNAKVHVIKQSYTLDVAGHSKQLFYICEYISGELQVIGEEAEKHNENDQYYVRWYDVDELNTLSVFPLEVRDWIVDDLRSGQWSTHKLLLESIQAARVK